MPNCPRNEYINTSLKFFSLLLKNNGSINQNLYYIKNIGKKGKNQHGFKRHTYFLVTNIYNIHSCYTFYIAPNYYRIHHKFFTFNFRLGRVKKGNAVGPGLFFIIPCLDSIQVEFSNNQLLISL